ncbi:MAG: S-methyl-5'-thioadenosine phosphorylase [Candidatus Aenigmatarchaeota archaeon]
MDDVQIAIIGGTGVYDPDILEDKKEINVETPFGSISAPIIVGNYENRKIAILLRHGPGHKIAPHNINYRANIYALKQLGVTHIISPSAVGSLQEDYHPGELVFVDQFIDRTHSRHSTFYDKDKVCHISVADPVCPDMRNIGIESAEELGLKHHKTGTYVCIQGPRFSTRAESLLFKSWNGHVIGMTMVPEAVLAREAEICYMNIATVTDYDSFKEEAVSLSDVLEIMKENTENVKNLIKNLIPKLSEERSCACSKALNNALI